MRGLDLGDRVGICWPGNDLNANMNRQPNLTRRQFLSTSALAATALSIVPRRVVAGSGEVPPSEKINIAGVGVGGQGAGDINEVAPGNNIVALCDVDLKHSAETFNRFPQAKQYRDFRKMFDELEKSIDAVVVATPDHCHAVAAMAAIKRRKHVYCEKPLAHSIHEVRELMRAAREYRVVSQLGNQGHSFETIRLFYEWVRDGAIGKVHTIHAGCNAVNSGLDQLPHLKEEHPVPPTLDWDLARPGPDAPLSPGLPAGSLARLGALRQRHGRRLDLPRGGPGVLGARPRRAGHHPGPG